MLATIASIQPSESKFLWQDFNPGADYARLAVPHQKCEAVLLDRHQQPVLSEQLLATTYSKSWQAQCSHLYVDANARNLQASNLMSQLKVR